MIIESIRYRFHQRIPGMQVSTSTCALSPKSLYTLTNCHLFKSMLPSNATYYSAEAVAWSASGNHQVPYSHFSNRVPTYCTMGTVIAPPWWHNIWSSPSPREEKCPQHCEDGAQQFVLRQCLPPKSHPQHQRHWRIAGRQGRDSSSITFGHGPGIKQGCHGSTGSTHQGRQDSHFGSWRDAAAAAIIGRWFHDQRHQHEESHLLDRRLLGGRQTLHQGQFGKEPPEAVQSHTNQTVR